MPVSEKHTRKTNPTQGLIIICTAAFLVPFMGASLNLALPQIATAFSIKAVTLTWLATAYIISTAIFQIPFARIADIVGRKKIFLTGVAGFTIFTFLCGFAPNEHVLIALRFLSGIASAMMFGTNIAILTSLFPPEKRGKALGINSAVVYAAAAAGPFIGGMLTHYLGWHSIFFVSAGVGVVVLFMAKFFLKSEWIEAKGEAFDWKGSIFYGLGLAGVIYGFSSLPKVHGFVSIILGIISFLVFIRIEMKDPYPVFNLKLFSGNRVFSLSSLAALINYAATSAIGFMLSLYLQYVRGYDAGHAGIILITQAAVQSVFSLVAGGLTQRFDSSRMATAGMMIIVIGIGGLIFLNEHTSVWIIVGILFILGVGFGIFSSPNTNVIMGSVDKRYYSSASAITGTMRLAGQAISIGIASMAISFHVGNQNIVPALYPEFLNSMRTTFIIFITLCCLGVYASSARLKKR